MIRDAVIVTSAADADRRVAGVPLLVRTLLVLQRAGVERCTVVGPVAVPADVRIRCAVTSTPALSPASDGRLRLVVEGGAVVDETLVRDVQRRAERGERPSLEADGARVRVTTDASGVPGAAHPATVGTLASAAVPCERLERTLLRGLENPRDGYFDRLVSRRLSRVLTPFILRTGLRPNHVTVIGVAIGVAGGLLLGSASPLGVVAGVLALVVSGVLDCADGEIARITFAESKLGHVLDLAGDTVVHGAVFGGIVLRLAHGAAWPGTAVLWLLGVGVLGAFAAITWSERTEARRHQAGDVWENRLLDGVLSPLTTRDWYVFPIAFALAGRLDLLAPAAAVGAQVFWMTVVVLVARVMGRARM